MLYVLWDLRQKVGHATRSVDECLKQARADMTIRTVAPRGAVHPRRRGAVRDAAARFDKEIVPRRPPNSSRRSSPSATPASRRPAASRYLVEPNVKDGKGGLRDLNTLFWIAKYVYRRARRGRSGAAGVFSRSRVSSCSAVARSFSGGPLPSPFFHRPGGGTPELRPSTPDRGPARLFDARRPHRASSGS